MNCEDFCEWLQYQLDERREIVLPPEMSDHIAHCDSCRGQVEAWNRIAMVMPGESASIVVPRYDRRRTLIGAIAIAAGLLLAVTLWQFSNVVDPAESLAQVDQSTLDASIEIESRGQRTGNSGESRELVSDITPSEFWQSIQQRDWIARSKTTVRSMREGVASMSRPIVSAVTIFTSNRRDQPS